MRTAGLLCVCAALALIGLRCARRAGAAARVLAGFAAFFEELRLSLSGAEGDLQTVLGGCIPRSELRFAGLLRESLAQTGDVRASWEIALSALPELSALDPADAALLSGFSGAFLCTSLHSFRENCGDYARACEARTAQAKQKQERQQRLIGTLSVLGAALVFILFV